MTLISRKGRHYIGIGRLIIVCESLHDAFEIIGKVDSWGLSTLITSVFGRQGKPLYRGRRGA